MGFGDDAAKGALGCRTGLSGAVLCMAGWLIVVTELPSQTYTSMGTPACAALVASGVWGIVVRARSRARPRGRRAAAAA